MLLLVRIFGVVMCKVVICVLMWLIMFSRFLL